MADLLQRGNTWLADTLRAHVSQTVTYWRCSKSVSVAATVGQTLYQVEDQGTGIATQWESRDFLIKPALLVIAGETITPEVGDEIEFDGKRYQVLPPSGEKHSRDSGPYGYLLRIHTKLIEL